MKIKTILILCFLFLIFVAGLTLGGVGGYLYGKDLGYENGTKDDKAQWDQRELNLKNDFKDSEVKLKQDYQQQISDLQDQIQKQQQILDSNTFKNSQAQ